MELECPNSWLKDFIDSDRKLNINIKLILFFVYERNSPKNKFAPVLVYKEKGKSISRIIII